MSPHPAQAIPSVDRLLRHSATAVLLSRYGRRLTTDALRQVLASHRSTLSNQEPRAVPDDTALVTQAAAVVERLNRPPLRPVFNLTGTVLHTNLGRAPLPPEAIAAMQAVAGRASNLEYDLEAGRRGDRDHHLEAWLCRLTGAEAATVVNNNAAALLLALNTLALRKDVPVSRGELIEIGDSFRLPDLIRRAGCRLREVGTTNRTHLRDYEEAVGPRTGALFKVHLSNYVIEGFTAAVDEPALANLARRHDLPLIVDLGSGALIDLSRHGLAREPLPGEVLRAGADLITFSGDKLLGGPQAGIIVGRKDLIRRLKRNPLKRALRIDKLTVAALAAVLPLYADPDTMATRLPALQWLTRPVTELDALAKRLQPIAAQKLSGIATVEIVACTSQPGSGALPAAELESRALALTTGSAASLKRLANALRALPVPVIGRLHKGTLLLDLRCLDDAPAFLDQLGAVAGHLQA